MTTGPSAPARHKLLARQIRRAFGEGGPPEGLSAFFHMVDEAYQQADEDRRLAERALELTSQDLEDRNERLRAFFDSAPFLMGMAQITATDVVLVSGNTAAQRIFGTPIRRATPLAASSLPTAIQNVWRERCDAALESSAPVRFEYRVGPEGAQRAYSATVARVRSALHQGMVCYVVEDVTEHRQFFEQLVLQDRRASLGTLAAGVAHEINNPLTYVLTNLVVAMEELDELPQHSAAPETLRRSLVPVIDSLRDAAGGAERVRAIVKDLKTFSGSESRALRSVDLVGVVRFAAKMAGVEIRKKARLELDFRAAPRALGEDTRLGQVFLNLLLNGCQAIEHGSPLTNEIRVVVDIDHEGTPYVDISDTGSGIEAAVVPLIFDPFFTTRAGGGGTGLGLAICAGIVRGLGGEIALLRTEEGKGSTFRVRLRPAAMTEEPRQVSLRPAAKRGRILVVDDDEHVGASIERVLSREHDVFFAIGARAAIDLLRDDQRFDLVLCDLRMPAGGGVAVFREIQRMAPALARRFVIVTGDPSAMQLEEIRAELSFPVIEKPFDPQTLRGLVREALAADGSP